MKNRLKNEKGFTLIELVMVIVILGILAATAIPRFIDLSTSAEESVRDGVTGALQGAVTMLHAQYLINNTSDYNSTTVAAQVATQGVTVAAASATSITATINSNTYSWTYGARAGNTAGTITEVP